MRCFSDDPRLEEIITPFKGLLKPTLRLPTIMLTAYGDAEATRGVFENGAELLLTQPIKMLRSEIERVARSAAQLHEFAPVHESQPLAQNCQSSAGRACPLCPGNSDVDLFRYGESIIYLIAEISDGGVPSKSCTACRLPVRR